MKKNASDRRETKRIVTKEAVRCDASKILIKRSWSGPINFLQDSGWEARSNKGVTGLKFFLGFHQALGPKQNEATDPEYVKRKRAWRCERVLSSMTLTHTQSHGCLSSPITGHVILFSSRIPNQLQSIIDITSLLNLFNLTGLS